MKPDRIEEKPVDTIDFCINAYFRDMLGSVQSWYSVLKRTDVKNVGDSTVTKLYVPLHTTSSLLIII